MTVSHYLISFTPIRCNSTALSKIWRYGPLPEDVLISFLSQDVPTCISGRRPCVAPLWWQRHLPPIGAGPRWSRALRPLYWPGVFWSSASSNVFGQAIFSTHWLATWWLNLFEARSQFMITPLPFEKKLDRRSSWINPKTWASTYTWLITPGLEQPVSPTRQSFYANGSGIVTSRWATTHHLCMEASLFLRTIQ